MIVIDGREAINFGSNDYLNLASDPRLTAAVEAALHEYGWGSGASPLLTGHAEPHRRLEQRLAEFEGTEAALVFTSGFAANAGTVAALAAVGDVVFTDRKNHASLIDGCRLSAPMSALIRMPIVKRWNVCYPRRRPTVICMAPGAV